MYIWVILLILYQTGWVDLQCITINPTNSHQCFKCIYKYFISSGRCYPCPLSCTKCTSRIDCSECKPYNYGTRCQYNCFGCSNENCVKTNGACPSDCNAGHFNQTNNKCAKCRAECKQCDDYDHCTECIEGTYLQQVSEHIYCTNCSSRCSSCSDFNKCTQCKQSNYWGAYRQNDCWVDLQCIEEHPLTPSECLKCRNNYYLSSSRCVSCPISCTRCTSNTVCSECKPYYYGTECQCNCLGCSNENCVKTEGAGPSDCKTGYYNQTNNSCVKCPTTCKECDGYVHCTECIDGTFLQQVSEHVYCENCSSRCSSCSNFKNCTQCKQSNFWGTYCQNDCEHCLSDCDKNDGCSQGCADGYYNTYNVSKGGYECSQCHTSCSSCNDISYCQECKDGYYGEANSLCIECSDNCRVSQHCDKFSGICMTGCRNGWSGDKCNRSCPSGCIACEQYNSSSCVICSKGLYGNQCERKCSRNCKTVDGIQVCNKSSGYCNHGCKHAFWGQTCENDCGTGCNGSICNRTTGLCINGCINEYYGDFCKTECNKHCLSREKYSSRNCDDETGECIFGCVSGWYGVDCGKKCSEQCYVTACERNNGVCTFGCVESYSGSRCLKATVSADNDSTNDAAIGGGAGAGIVILVTVVAVISFLLWRRRHQRTETTNTPVSGESQGDNRQESEYQNIMLNTLDRSAGVGNDSVASTSASDSNMGIYQELQQRTLSENAYYTFATGSSSSASNKSKVSIHSWLPEY